MAEHLSVGIVSLRSLLGIETPEFRGIHRPEQVLGVLLAHPLADDHVGFLGAESRGEFCAQFAPIHSEKRGGKRCQLGGILNTGPVGGDGADRHVHRKFLAVTVEDAASARRNHLLDQMLLGGDRREVIVLEHLKIDESPGKPREDQDQQGAEHADAPCHSVHRLRTRWGTPGPNLGSVSREAVRSTPSASAGMGGVTRAMAVSRIVSRRM